MKILIIEDDKDIANLAAYNFKQEKWECETVENGFKGLQQARKVPPDLIILDLMLPDVGGLEVCRALKADEKTKRIPIIMLTAKGEEIDRVVGFEMGADDYITKPFSPRELVLRVKAILNRLRNTSRTADEKPVVFGLLSLDPVRHQVAVAQKEIMLTATEFKLLHYFLKNKGRVATRDILLDQVWGYEAALTTRTVDAHIKRLREKMGKAGDYIETIHGTGYRFREKE